MSEIKPLGYTIEYSAHRPVSGGSGWSPYRTNHRMFVLTTGIERALEFFAESFPPEAQAVAHQVVLRTALDARIDPLLGWNQ